jgi:hypothetical protein
MNNSPFSGEINPAIIFNNDVFPVPLSPNIP